MVHRVGSMPSQKIWCSVVSVEVSDQWNSAFGGTFLWNTLPTNINKELRYLPSELLEFCEGLIRMLVKRLSLHTDAQNTIICLLSHKSLCWTGSLRLGSLLGAQLETGLGGVTGRLHWRKYPGGMLSHTPDISVGVARTAGMCSGWGWTGRKCDWSSWNKLWVTQSKWIWKQTQMSIPNVTRSLQEALRSKL